MVRLCERPGCSVPADVTYGFDAEHLVVWLDGFQAAPGVRCGVLCRRHADAMVVPLGWMLDDRREPVPRLFRPPAEAPTGPMVRPRPKRPRVDPEQRTVQLQLGEYGAGADLASAVDDAVSEVLAAATDEVPAAELGAGPRQEPAPSTVVRAEPAAEAEPPVDEAAVEPEIRPWQPVFDESDDLHGLLKARGRLLSRAFHGVAANDS
jgi:hypothetical protein